MIILVTICARGGSKGIPGKNKKLLAGKPLIAYTIEVAMRFATIFNADIAISTDDDDIKNIAMQYGIFINYNRPMHLATDTAGKIETIKDLIYFQEAKNNLLYDYILDLDITSPLRSIKDLCDGFEILIKDSNALNLFSVNNAARNPYFNMVEEKENGYFYLVKNEGKFLTRQSAPKVYDLNASFYFYKRIFFDLNLSTVFTSNSLIYEMPHICFDLDHKIDFDFLEFLINNKRLDFELC
jgi:CMP-N,N'-diacetyllegionaminic acid synthase